MLSTLAGKIKLVAISGAAGSGKDTLARALCGQFGYRKYSFAEPIYEMLNRLPYLEHIHGAMPRDMKEEVINFYGKSPRQLLQTLGTEWGRNCVHPDIWIRIMEDKLRHRFDFLAFSSFVISDLRFENEAEWVRSVGGLVVKLHRSHDIAVHAHSSENGLIFHPDDIQLANDGTIEELCQQASRIDDLASRAPQDRNTESRSVGRGKTQS